MTDTRTDPRPEPEPEPQPEPQPEPDAGEAEAVEQRGRPGVAPDETTGT